MACVLASAPDDILRQSFLWLLLLLLPLLLLLVGGFRTHPRLSPWARVPQ